VIEFSSHNYTKCSLYCQTLNILLYTDDRRISLARIYTRIYRWTQTFSLRENTAHK